MCPQTCYRISSPFGVTKSNIVVRCESRRRSFALDMSSACLASVGEGFNSMNIRLAARPWRLDYCVHGVLQRNAWPLGVACNRVRVSPPRIFSMTLFAPCSFAAENATECSISRHDCRSEVCPAQNYICRNEVCPT